jgi:hypothetical protein
MHNQIWKCGTDLWNMASISDVEILERFQPEALRMIVNAPWYISTTVISRDLQILTVKSKSAVTALNTVHTWVYTQTTY